MTSVTIVIPAYNEEKRITATIAAVQRLPYQKKIIVVNDGSSDATADVVKKAGVFLIDLPENRGKGGAMNAAVPHIDTGVVAFLDADLGESALEAGRIIQPVLAGQADLCIAAFPRPAKKGGFGLVKGTARWYIRRAGGIDVQAPLSGQRAMTIDVLSSVIPFAEAYGVELAMTIKALQYGYTIMEVPTSMRHHETGRDLQGFLHRGRQFIDVVKVICTSWRRKSM